MLDGILTLLENYTVKKIIISKQTNESENYISFKRIVKEKNLEVIEVNKGDRLKIEKDIYIDILWPDNENTIKDNELNNNSIVCKLYYSDFSILFTGDIEELAEKEIIEEYASYSNILKSTILKVAHHGSKSSSIQQFIKNVDPKIALIGVGEDNKFGHPSGEALQRLEEKNVRIYRTDKNGEITFKINKKGKIISIQKCIN